LPKCQEISAWTQARGRFSQTRQDGFRACAESQQNWESLSLFRQKNHRYGLVTSYAFAKSIVVLLALCADVEPQARRCTKANREDLPPDAAYRV
jgi:hypothetical protein